MPQSSYCMVIQYPYCVVLQYPYCVGYSRSWPQLQKTNVSPTSNRELHDYTE